MASLKNQPSIRSNLVAIIGIILIIGFVASSAISYQVSKNSLRDALIGNELPLTSDNIYSEIQRDLLRPVFVASMMADDTFVRDWLLEGEEDPTKITRYLEEIRKQHGMFTSFLVSENTRRYYHFTGISQIVAEDDPKDKWYFRVRDMAQRHEINVDLNAEQQDALTIFINHKVFDYDGNYLATTGVGIAFDVLGNVVERYKENFSRHVYFVDHTGRIMARSDGATMREDNINEADGASEIATQLFDSEHSFFEYDRNGETMLASARHIPELNWWVIIEQEEATALVDIRRSLITNFVIGVIAISLTLVIVLYAVNLFYARLEQKATEMTELAEHEARLNEELQHESELKDKFFSIISHDLIAPFSTVLLGTEMLSKNAETYSKAKIIETSDMVHERAQSVFNLLRNLLDWALLQIDGTKLERRELRLHDVAADSISVLAPIAVEKEIEIVNSIKDETVFADANTVDTVLRNLISNALKYSSKDGRIAVSAKQLDGEIQVTVSDTGVGISKDRLDKLFDMGGVTSTRGTGGEQGTGLGLNLCKEMIELDGGKFWVESVEESGSHFHFTLSTAPQD